MADGDTKPIGEVQIGDLVTRGLCTSASVYVETGGRGNMEEFDKGSTDLDLGAGFVGWRNLQNGHVVVSCAIFDLAAHESIWLAVSTTTRGAGFASLKDWGVHRLKTNRNEWPTQDWLAQLAEHQYGKVVVVRDPTVAS